MIESFKKSFDIYSKKPFLFVWGSLLYIFMLATFLFAALGIFLIYFFILSVFGEELDLMAIPTLVVFGVIALILLFLINGINASLIMTYKKAVDRGRVSLAQFYSHGIKKAPVMFIIMVVREFFWLLLVGPAIAAYVLYLQEYELMDWLIGTYSFFMTFAIHMFFTPAFVLAGAFDSNLFDSLKYGIRVWRKRHIFFIGLYIVFAFAWIFNFIPFIQLASIFFLFPVVYTAIAIMIDNTIRIGDD